MAFKFPAFFPLGGGARRKVDPDTAIVDDLNPTAQFDPLGAPTRFGETISAGPGGAAPTAARQGFQIPFVGKLPLRKQLSVLFPVLGASLVLAFLFMWLDARQASAVAMQARLVGDSLMHSQRLAKAAPLAVRGTSDGFRMLGESRSRLGEAKQCIPCRISSRSQARMRPSWLQRQGASIAITRALWVFRHQSRSAATLAVTSWSVVVPPVRATAWKPLRSPPTSMPTVVIIVMAQACRAASPQRNTCQNSGPRSASNWLLFSSAAAH